jgi:hypothetical protein
LQKNKERNVTAGQMAVNAQALLLFRGEDNEVLLCLKVVVVVAVLGWGPLHTHD